MSSGIIDESQIKKVLRSCARQYDLDPQLLFDIYEKERSALSQRHRTRIFNDLRKLVSASIKGDEDKTQDS